MQIEEIIKRINAFLVEEFEVDEEKITPEANLKETLQLDSLDYIDLVVAIESNFAFKVKPEDFAGITTFQDLYDYVIIHKQAKEGMARIYSQDYGLHAVGLRPHTVYGPGRDQGMTSTPTKAMLAAAIGRPYQITFGGTIVMEHADDMAQVFIDAARAKPEQAGAYDVGGNTVAVDAIVEAINAALAAW